MKKYTREFVMYTDPDIDTLYFGGLPSEGRYFTKKCEKLNQGMFKVEVQVPKGELYYHFKSEDDKSIVLLDPGNTQVGAKNWHSICRIGTISLSQIEFDIMPSYISRISEGQMEIKAIAYQSCIKRISILFLGDSGAEYEMLCHYDYVYRKYFRVCIDLNKIKEKEFLLKVYCEDGDILYFGNNKQLSPVLKNPYCLPDELLEEIMVDDLGVVYQIFPDSFNYEKVIWVEGRKMIGINAQPSNIKFYGGNPRGIIDKISYLTSLGVNAIYLTPIFYANSNHRYDCIDYFKIDKMLGTNQDFRELIEVAHASGIKIILDIVLNHSGKEFWMFADILEKQEDSEYKENYILYNFPVKYEPVSPNYSCWWEYGDMPQFNLENDKMKEYMFACCSYWIDEYDIDGWRIDVSSELSHNLLKELRAAMNKNKKVKLIGENRKDARSFLRGDELDGVTNYLSWWNAFVPYFCTNEKNYLNLQMP